MALTGGMAQHHNPVARHERTLRMPFGPALPIQRNRDLRRAIFPPPQAQPTLLHKSHIGRLRRGGCLANRPKLRLETRNVFAKSAPEAFGVAWADDCARYQLAMGSVGIYVNEMQCEFFGIVMNHYQVAVLPDELFFVGFDLHLRTLLFSHISS